MEGSIIARLIDGSLVAQLNAVPGRDWLIMAGYFVWVGFNWWFLLNKPDHE
jgi:hypothetical protein